LWINSPVAAEASVDQSRDRQCPNPRFWWVAYWADARIGLSVIVPGGAVFRGAERLLFPGAWHPSRQSRPDQPTTIAVTLAGRVSVGVATPLARRCIATPAWLASQPGVQLTRTW